MERRDLLRCGMAGMLGLTITPNVFASRKRKGRLCGVGSLTSTAQIFKDKWGKRHLTYYMNGRDTGEMKADVWDNEFRLAFDSWSEVTPITFERSDNFNNSNIIITVSRRKRSGYGRSGGILASAQLPHRRNFNGTLWTTFDLAEHWTLPNNDDGIILRSVACHEIGHLLGLDHSKDEDALMYPYINDALKPRKDDIARIQKLYGSKD